MKILAYGITDVGRIREINEDSFCVEGFKDGQPLGYALLADGMGGHNAGEVASSTAVEVVKGELEKTIDVKEHDKIVYNIMSSIDYANTKVYDLSKHDISKAGMGSTFVAAYVVDDKLYVANIGDSRAYLITKDETIQITVDHSVVQELVERGSITIEEAAVHPDKNIITRALGTEKFVDADFFEYSLKVGDYILLCSDGLSEMVESSLFSETLEKTEEIEDAAKELVRVANENGGRDNITIIILKCVE